METNQLAYLEAMNIPVWVRKELAGQEPDHALLSLKLGPGTSEVLLVCSDINEPAKQIAADIARCLSVEPVWAWPDDESDSRDLISLVSEQLFTTVIIFGGSLATQLFGSRVPEAVASARMLQAASLDELVSSPDAKRSLWKLIKENSLNGKSRK
jgi:hypothetical protein